MATRRITKPVHRWTLHYRQDRNLVRVWRDGWAGDMFEVLTQDEFNDFREQACRFNIAFELHAED